MQRVLNTPASYIFKGCLQQQGTKTNALLQTLPQTASWKQRANPAMIFGPYVRPFSF
jgi:hypothetical protein